MGVVDIYSSGLDEGYGGDDQSLERVESQCPLPSPSCGAVVLRKVASLQSEEGRFVARRTRGEGRTVTETIYFGHDETERDYTSTQT